MSNPSVAPFYYLETGPLFEDTFTTLGGEWTPVYESACVVPESVVMESGSEPGKMIFHVYADETLGPQGVFPPIATSDISIGVRCDGDDGFMALPAVAGAPLKPFTTIRLREADTPADVSESNPYRFVGIVLNAQLDLATETWMITALEIPRWRMSKYVVDGLLWHDSNKADVDNPVVFQKYLPVFNEDGKKDMWVDGAGDRQLQFYHPDYRTGAATWGSAFWRLGDMLNYLRLLYWEIVPATGKTILGIDGMSAYMDWPVVTDVTHPFLFTQDANDQVMSDMALGGMTLLEAVDTIIRKAGDGVEWTMTFDYDTAAWQIGFYDRHGLDDVTLSRGSMGATIGEPPDISGGTVEYDWTNAADRIKVYGKMEMFEVAVAYDPNNVMGGYFPDQVEAAWTPGNQLSYQTAELALAEGAETDFPNVFVKFKFKETKDWGAAFGTLDPTRQGQREILDQMLTKATTGNAEIQGKVWRWLRTDDGVPLFTSQPETVSLTINPDGTFSVHGHRVKDTAIPGTELDTQPKKPRFLCNIPDDGSPWTVRPFIVTMAVLGDHRTMMENTAEPPDDWPRHLEDAPDLNKSEEHFRYRVLHFLDIAANPTEDEPFSTALVSPLIENIHSNWHELLAVANRRAGYIRRPKGGGSITLGGNLQWGVTPGMSIQTITGGSGDPALPVLPLGILIQRVTFNGLGTVGLMDRSQTLELGNG